MLHRVDFGERVERAHDEEGVAKPAVAIIPVAPAVGGLRDARRHRRDDGAGFLEGAELQRDRGAYHRVLPLRRDREPACPLPPVGLGLLLGSPRRLLGAVRERFIRAQHEVHRGLEQERRFRQHVAHRRVGRQAQHAIGAHVPDVIAAMGDLRPQRPVSERRPEPDADARRSGERAHAPHERLRPEHPAEPLEARAKIDHLDGRSIRAEEARDENRGVRDVLLLAALETAELDRPEAARTGRARIVDQRMKHRIAVQARQAAPHDARLAIDEGRDDAVAGNAEVERGGLCHFFAPASSAARLAASQSRTASTAAIR